MAERRRPPFNRGTGLLVIEVRNGNPNGDPDREGAPRIFESDKGGMISPVSVKRKVRELVLAKEEAPWQTAANRLQINDTDHYQILEDRFRLRHEILPLPRDKFQARYWDARVFGCTFLESLEEAVKAREEADGAAKGASKKSAKKAGGSTGVEKNKAAEERMKLLKSLQHFITTGTVQVGLGTSVSPVEIVEQTWTNKSGVQEGMDRGMAPLAYKIVRHGVYTVPFFVNPSIAFKAGCEARDIDLLKRLIPFIYRDTASGIRQTTFLRHAWYVDHGDPLGACPDHLILDALTPRRKDADARGRPSEVWEEYEVPEELSGDVMGYFRRRDPSAVSSGVLEDLMLDAYSPAPASDETVQEA
jgi:CRISPR/Cas system type I-B associated protein Csh2 (Cas7 group RAMP superfamily)